MDSSWMDGMHSLIGSDLSNDFQAIAKPVSHKALISRSVTTGYYNVVGKRKIPFAI
jgi:hypothetical protein